METSFEHNFIILQVGTIYELVGDAAEAETFLNWGKNISSTQDLPHFIVAFSCVLGTSVIMFSFTLVPQHCFLSFLDDCAINNSLPFS